MSARRPSPNRDILVATARRIKPMLADIVFVGGQVTELLITDPGAARIRATNDVDVVVRVTSRHEYNSVEQYLQTLGFMHDTRAGAPICRMCTRDGLILDVMPLDADILGFTNSWYPYALETARLFELEPELWIHVASPSAFLAMKWEAFAGRGQDDPLASHDLEDIVALVAGRDELTSEIMASPPEVREYIAAQTRMLLSSDWGPEAVEANLPDARSISGLVDSVVIRLRTLSEMGD